MFTDSEIASCLLTWAEHGAATIVRLKAENQDLREEIEAMKMLMSPPALIPIADVPVRDVTHIQMEDDPA